MPLPPSFHVLSLFPHCCTPDCCRYDGSDRLRTAMRPSGTGAIPSSSSGPSPFATAASAATAAALSTHPGAASGSHGSETGAAAVTDAAATAGSAFTETSEALQLPGLQHYAQYLPLPGKGGSPATPFPAAAVASSSTTGSVAAAGAAAGAGASPGAAPTPDPKAGLVLLLAKLCSFLEQQQVPWVMETLAVMPTLSTYQQPGVTTAADGAAAGGPLAGAREGRGAGGATGAGAALLPPSFVPGELARRLGAASAALLSLYVELHGRQLSLMVSPAVL